MIPGAEKFIEEQSQDYSTGQCDICHVTAIFYGETWTNFV